MICHGIRVDLSVPVLRFLIGLSLYPQNVFIQPYMIHIVKTELTLVRPPDAQYVANVLGNLGFRAAPICAVQETVLRICKKGGQGNSVNRVHNPPLTLFQVCLSVNTSVPLSMSSCFCVVDSLLLENVIVLPVFLLLQIW